jgi:hypothetical protein
MVFLKAESPALASSPCAFHCRPFNHIAQGNAYIHRNVAQIEGWHMLSRRNVGVDFAAARKA